MMHVRYATEPAPGGGANEDYVLHAGPLIVVLDGASTPEGMDTGCVHGTPWYVTRLAAQLAHAVDAEPAATLTWVLATAIAAVRQDHGGQCDLEHQGTPAAAIGMIRDRGDALDYLILCDTTLICDQGGDIQVLTDSRFNAAMADLRAHAYADAPAFGTAEHAVLVRRITNLRLQRINRPDGYWVAAANPDAADHAITGQLPLNGPDRVRRAALLTDGAADAVSRYQLLTWPALLDLLTTSGPHELIGQVRAAEDADAQGHAQPRYKAHDDATVALCLFTPPEQP